MKRIFLEHLEGPAAQADLDVLAELMDGPRRVCILCFEANPEHCHRTLVADALAAAGPPEVVHLRPGREEPD